MKNSCQLKLTVYQGQGPSGNRFLIICHVPWVQVGILLWPLWYSGPNAGPDRVGNAFIRTTLSQYMKTLNNTNCLPNLKLSTHFEKLKLKLVSFDFRGIDAQRHMFSQERFVSRHGFLCINLEKNGMFGQTCRIEM